MAGAAGHRRAGLRVHVAPPQARNSMHVRQHITSRDGLCFSHRIIEHPAPSFSPTLFVSGAFQTMDSWARFARLFAQHTTVLLVDPPGMGDSDLLPPEAGVDYLAACLAQVLDEHGIEKATLISASYGTPAAFTLAARCPERVDRIVLAGTMKELPLHIREPVARTIGLARHLERERLVAECLAGMLCHDPRVRIERRASSARVLRSSIGRMSDEELMKFAANSERLLNHQPLALHTRIHGPEALVFTGEHDVFTPVDAGREVAVGIRSEDMEDASLARDAASRARLTTSVSLTEALGSEIMAHVNVPGARAASTEDVDLPVVEGHGVGVARVRELRQLAPPWHRREGSPHDRPADA